MKVFFIGGETHEGTAGLIVEVSSNGIISSFRVATEKDGFDEGITYLAKNPTVGSCWFDYWREMQLAMGAIYEANQSTPHLFPKFIMKELSKMDTPSISVEMSGASLNLVNKLVELALSSNHPQVPHTYILRELKSMNQSLLHQMQEDVTRIINLNL